MKLLFMDREDVFNTWGARPVPRGGAGADSAAFDVGVDGGSNPPRERP